MTERSNAVRFIAALTFELAALARAQRLPVIAQLLDMATLEANLVRAEGVPRTEVRRP